MNLDKMKIYAFIKKYKWFLSIVAVAMLFFGFGSIREIYRHHSSPKRYIQEYWQEYSMEILYENEIAIQDTGELLTLAIYRNTKGEFYSCLFKKIELLLGLPWYTEVVRSSPIPDSFEPEMETERISLRISCVDQPKRFHGERTWLFFGILYDSGAVGYSINGHSCNIVEAEGSAAGVMRERRFLYLVTSEIDTDSPLTCKVS